jgi:hypothetical protein
MRGDRPPRLMLSLNLRDCRCVRDRLPRVPRILLHISFGTFSHSYNNIYPLSPNWYWHRLSFSRMIELLPTATPCQQIRSLCVFLFIAGWFYWWETQQRTKTENWKQLFPEKELRDHGPNFHIHLSKWFIYSHDWSANSAAGNMWTDPGNI